MRRPLVNALAAYLTLAWLVSGCTEPPGQPEDASSLDASSDADASLPLPDAMSDARVLPIVTQHDFCALPWFKLPVDGPSEETTGIRLADQHVVYSRSHFNQGIGTKELHLLNLETCIDAQQTSGARVWAPFKRNFEVVWEDFASPTPQSGVGCSDLVLLDLQSQRMHTVPLTTGFENSPVLTENLAFFLASNGCEWGARSALIQLDRATLEVTELAPTDALVESFELSERYLVWAAYVQDPDPESQGRTVFYKDLETGEVTAVEASKPRLQYHVCTHGDFILWEGGDVYLEPPSHLMLYHIPTGDSTIITELEGTNPLGDVHGRVVALSTTHYRTDGQLTFWPSDVALYDIDSEVMRRVTVQSGYLRAMRLSDQHLLVAEFTGPSPQSWNWYLLDLRQLGLVDEEGHVLEGEPVFDPSEPPGIR